MLIILSSTFSFSQNGLEFDGSNDRVTSTFWTGISGNQARTIEAWINPDNIAVDRCVASLGQGANRFSIRLQNGGRLRLDANGVNVRTALGVIPTNAWTHIAVAFPGGNIDAAIFYVNGVVFPHTTNATAVNTNNNSLRVGHINNNNYFDGTIDEVRVWNDVRSSAEVLQYMTSEPCDKSNLVVQYHLDEVAGVVAADAVGPNNGNLTNFPGAPWVPGIVISDNCNNDDPCTANVVSSACGSKSLGTNSGATDSGIAAPSCGSYAGGDRWYSVIIPASGELTLEYVSTVGGITDMGMAAYTTPDCSNPALFTEVGCSAASMPNMSLTGLTPGNTLYIRAWENDNDNTGSFEIEVTDPSNLFCLNGTATMPNFPADSCMQSTDAVGNQAGCAWYQNTLDFSQDFDFTFDVYLGNNDAGADGQTIVFHSDPTGTNVCGIAGGGLAAEGINNALIIEMDTWNNGCGGGEPERDCANLTWTDEAFDHVAIWTSVTGKGNPLFGPIRALPGGGNIEDGVTHAVRIVWVDATKTLDVYFDGFLRMSVTSDFVANVFGSKNVFWGTTGSTGGANNQQYICPPTALITLPVELVDFESNCSDQGVELNWSTITELNNDYFIIESSTNDSNWERIGAVEGAGTSTTEKDYEFVDVNPKGDAMYYRLIQVDYDGTETISHAVSAYCLRSQSGIFVYPNPANDFVVIGYPNPSEAETHIVIRDMQGRRVFDQFYSDKMSQTKLNTQDFNAGHYLINVTQGSNVYNKKLVIR